MRKRPKWIALAVPVETYHWPWILWASSFLVLALAGLTLHTTGI